MKVLWVTNIPLPEYSKLVGEKPIPYGGWLVDSSQRLSKYQNIKMAICFPVKGVKSIVKVKGESIDYYAFNPIQANMLKIINKDNYLRQIIDEVSPDIVNIHGTEMIHSLMIARICKQNNIKCVVNLQGLVSFIAKHNRADLPNNIFYGATFRNVIKGDSVHGLSKKYTKRGEYEKETLDTSLNVIGRTTWDQSCIEKINPNIKYYSSNESLRESFYHHKWNIDSCEKYSVFLSQGYYSIKGLHYALEAMRIILKKYPQTKLYVGGNDPTKTDSLKDKLLITQYGKYIKRFINKYNIGEKVVFTGPLDEKQMCQRYLKSHVFICPSSIENSPNSLGEAMILGVPSVASFVGGIADMLKNKTEGFLYQHDASYMLAYYVCEIFKNDNLALEFSNNARERALKTHDRDNNTKTLVNIYNNILLKND